MKKPAKIGCFAVLVMALLFFLGTLGVFIFADVIIEVAGKRIAENVVPGITGTGFFIGDVKSSVSHGKIRLTDVVIKNPEGYTGYAMKAGTVYIEVDMNSILTDKIVIKQVLIENVSVNYERTLSGSNIDAIQKNIEVRSSKPEQKSTADMDMETKTTGKGKAWVIRNFDLKKGSISIVVSISKSVSATVPLSDIHIENLGEVSGGKTLYEILPEIFTMLFSDILKAVSSGGFGPGIVDDLQKAPSSVIKTIKNLF